MQPGVDDVLDAVYGNGGLGNVGGQYNLARVGRRGLKNLEAFCLRKGERRERRIARYVSVFKKSERPSPWTLLKGSERFVRARRAGFRTGGAVMV